MPDNTRDAHQPQLARASITNLVYDRQLNSRSFTTRSDVIVESFKFQYNKLTVSRIYCAVQYVFCTLPTETVRVKQDQSHFDRF